MLSFFLSLSKLLTNTGFTSIMTPSAGVYPGSHRVMVGNTHWTGSQYILGHTHTPTHLEAI